MGHVVIPVRSFVCNADLRDLLHVFTDRPPKLHEQEQRWNRTRHERLYRTNDPPSSLAPFASYRANNAEAKDIIIGSRHQVILESLHYGYQEDVRAQALVISAFNQLFLDHPYSPPSGATAIDFPFVENEDFSVFRPILWCRYRRRELHP